MHWVLQLGLENSPAEETMVEVLKENNLPYTLAKVVPFSHELIPEPTVIGKTIAYGGIVLKDIVAKRNWNPGFYINENFCYQAWKNHWGKNLLNHDAKVSSFKKVKKICDKFFIRPSITDKVFTGSVVTWEEFESWREEVKSGKVNQYYHGLTMNTEVSYAPFKEIFSECRFFIVGGKIVTASYYRRKDTHKYLPFYSPWYDKEMERYVKERIKEWLPHKAFVLDIAQTNEGYKVIEINVINSSGLYECNVEKIVLALEELER